MTGRTGVRRAGATAGLVAALLLVPGREGAPGTTLDEFGAHHGGRWTALGPDDAPPPLEPRWQAAGSGVDWARLHVGPRGGWRASVVVVRLDPTRLTFALERRTRSGGTLGDWSVDETGRGPIVALNAGQFEGGRPWGWVVRDGLELQPPGRGPLSSALTVDTAGRVTLVPADEIPIVRYRPEIVQAFQSYPTLLRDGRVPEPLQVAGRGVDLDHRDIRLALGTLEDGRMLVVLTRFAQVGGVSLPFGPTVPETARLMRALGAVDAVMLDGGLSAQLRLGAGDSVGVWRGGRRVPLGLVATPRRAGPAERVSSR